MGVSTKPNKGDLVILKTVGTLLNGTEVDSGYKVFIFDDGDVNFGKMYVMLTIIILKCI